MVAVLLTGLKSPEDSPPEEAVASEPWVSVSVRASERAVVAGSPAFVSGRAPSEAGTAVALERERGQNWEVVARGRLDSQGRFRLRFPTDWYRDHRVRVRSVETERVSPVLRVRVKPAYRPRGRRTSWTHLDSTKARWDACEPITWSLAPSGGYPEQLEDFKQAFAEVGRATGFRFTYAGEVRDLASGRERARIVISWGTPASEPRLRGRVTGLATSTWESRPGAVQRVRGAILLDSTEVSHPDRQRLTEEGEFTPALQARVNSELFSFVVLHELGHLMGLGHEFSDGEQVMNYTGQLQWGRGDLAGLEELGAGAALCKE